MSNISTADIIEIDVGITMGVKVGVLMAKRAVVVLCSDCGEWFFFIDDRGRYAKGGSCSACMQKRSELRKAAKRSGVRHPRIEPRLQRFHPMTIRKLQKCGEELARDRKKFEARLRAEEEALRLAQAKPPADRGYRSMAIAQGDSIDHRSIFKRDNNTCHICGFKVDRSKCHPHPLAPTIDHIHPLVHGGEHTIENVACAHSYCNSVKHSRTRLTDSQVDAMRIHIRELTSLKVSA